MYASITLLPDIRHYIAHPVALYVSGVSAILLLLLLGWYILHMPVSNKLRNRPKLAYLVFFGAVVLYIFLLFAILMLLAPAIPTRNFHELGVLCGNVGLIFGVLLLYTNMKGQPIADQYNQLWHELEEIELDTSCTEP